MSRELLNGAMGYLINLFKRIELANNRLYQNVNAVRILHGFFLTPQLTPLEIIHGVASSKYRDPLTHNYFLDTQLIKISPFIDNFYENFEVVKRYLKLVKKTLRDIKEECDALEPELYRDKLTKLADIFFMDLSLDTLPVKSYKLYLTRVDDI